MRVVVQVWTQDCINAPQTDTENFWGIGDFLRGTVQLYMLSKKLGFHFYVDISLHPMSKYLIPVENPYRSVIQENKNRIQLLPSNLDLEKLISTFQDGLYFFFTNAHCTYPISTECQEFIKNMLVPIPSLEHELSMFPFKKYEIMHLRLGDKELLNNGTAVISQELVNMVQKNTGENTILISDSLSVKENADILKYVYITNTKPKHTGKCSDSDSMKDTLIEFLLITRSSCIKTYSCYSWRSGFVDWAHKIYNIPIHDITS
jgi:hypothetical protein